MNSNTKDRNSVDLGLGEILNPIKGQVAESETTEPITIPRIYPAKQFSNSWTLDETAEKIQPVQDLDEYRQLWQKLDYPKLITLAEQDSSKEGHARLIAKIWWVRAHAKLADLPISFLVASLLGQNLAENLKNANAIELQLVEQVLLELSNQISPEENTKTSIQLMEQLSCLNTKYKSNLLRLVNKELEKDRIPASNHYEQQLNEEYRKYLMNLKSQHLGDALGDNALANTVPLGENLAGPITYQSPKKNQMARILVIISLLFIAIFYLLNDPKSNQEMSVLITSSEKILAKDIETSEVKLDLPSNTRVPIGETAKLDTILDDLIQKETKQNSVGVNNNSTALPDTNSKINGNTKVNSKAIASINTDGPVESNELAELVNAYDHNKLDTLDNSVSSEAPLLSDTLTRESANNPIVAGYDKIPGTDKKQAGRIFKVVRSSDVYKQPSLRSARLANLQSGQHVEVVEYLGSWLKIRSEKGREGYIFSNCCE